MMNTLAIERLKHAMSRRHLEDMENAVNLCIDRNIENDVTSQAKELIYIEQKRKGIYFIYDRCYSIGFIYFVCLYSVC